MKRPKTKNKKQKLQQDVPVAETIDEVTSNEVLDWNKKQKRIAVALSVMIVLAAGVLGWAIDMKINEKNVANKEQIVVDEKEKEKEKIEQVPDMSNIAIKGNDLDAFDLSFLKLENAANKGKKDIVYSPLSIKYALSMLSAGAAGKTKEQIDKVLGVYNFKKYTTGPNLSLANALFVNKAYQDKMKPAYIDNLRTNYGAEVLFDDFATPKTINSWVSDKTFGLIKKLIDKTDPTWDQYYLINALGIDMEWVNKIQTPKGGTPFSGYHDNFMSYTVSFEYEKAYPTSVDYYNEDEFEIFAATANKYDIMKELGEEKIRSTIQKDYDEWAKKRKDELKDEKTAMCKDEAEIAAQAPDLNKYVETLKGHYGHNSSSTDFYYYDGKDVAAFAKDLKTYNDTTLQYVAISPKDKNIKKYVNDTSAEDLNKILKGLKDLSWDSYEDGYVTLIGGSVKNFDYQYDLDLEKDLKALGISDAFSEKVANLSNIIDDKSYITTAVHSANFAFSNDGIRASAATGLGGGRGSAVGCSYYYAFEVPKKEINLNFGNGYIFLVRDKESGEVWFVGAKNK